MVCVCTYICACAMHIGEFLCGFQRPGNWAAQPKVMFSLFSVENSLWSKTNCRGDRVTIIQHPPFGIEGAMRVWPRASRSPRK